MVGVKDSVKNNATINARMKEATEIASMGSESELRELAHKLSERIKELNCLYGISKLVEEGNSSVDEILQDVVDLIPPSWQYPEVTCACIKLKDQQFKTTNFRETNWKHYYSVP
jgi:hypothetical protein